MITDYVYYNSCVVIFTTICFQTVFIYYVKSRNSHKLHIMCAHKRAHVYTLKSWNEATVFLKTVK